MRGKPEEGVGSPENGVTVVNHHVGSEPQSCAEQPEFLTAEPALPHPTPLLASNPTKRSTDRPRPRGPGLAEAGGLGKGRGRRVGGAQWAGPVALGSLRLALVVPSLAVGGCGAPGRVPQWTDASAP